MFLRPDDEEELIPCCGDWHETVIRLFCQVIKTIAGYKHDRADKQEAKLPKMKQSGEK
jgi:hypothetical protein